jgi:GntR family transcriptional regulator
MVDTPTSKTLHENLAEIIHSAEVGTKLNSEPKLAKELGVSRATLREAMRTFETRGFLRRQQGVGTFVTRPSHVIESGLEVLESIERMAERIGLQVSMGKIEVKSCAADLAAAQKLKLDPRAEVFFVSRVIMAEQRPVAYLVDIVPSNYLNYEDVGDNFNGSVLDLFLERGEPLLGNSRCEIAAIAAPTEVSRALNIQRGDSLMKFEALLYDKDGHPVDYSFSYFLPGYFKFHVVRSVG